MGAMQGTVQAVICLLNHGADLGATDNNGGGVLRSAAAARNSWQLGVMELLISRGASLELEDDDGATPLQLVHGKDRRQSSNISWDAVQTSQQRQLIREHL